LGFSERLLGSIIGAARLMVNIYSRQFHPGADAQLSEDLSKVEVDGVTGEKQARGNLRIT
jgi:hypothetical protein